MRGHLRSIQVTALFFGALTACGITAVGTRVDDVSSDASTPVVDGAIVLEDGAIVFVDGGVDGSPAPVDSGPLGRVAGAIALYTFDDGTGKKVSDVSGVAPALDLTIQVNDSTRWTDGGLAVDATSLLFSGPASKIVSACKASNEVTVEAWVNSSTITNGTIQRITAISVGVAFPVVSVSAQNDTVLFRIRTSTQASDAENDYFSTGGLKVGLQHIALTRRADGVYRGYIDGALVVDKTTGGNLSTWTDQAICVANEHTTDRPWIGELRLVAYYAKALTQAEIQQNIAAGP